MQGAVCEVACLGEALALVADVDEPVDARLAGAEANVAVGLAAAGVRVSWLGRLGTDPLGDILLAALTAAGVETGAVERDPHRPTGRYAKRTGIDEHGEPATTMVYRRAGSAASAMDPGFRELPAVAERLAQAEIVHVSGITAALSPGCSALMHALVTGPRSHLLAFDVNWREQMWPDGDPATVVALAGHADVVLTGGDEAARVFGTADPGQLRALLPGPRLIVVKDGPRRALAIDRVGEVVARPALAVEVVEPVGAGDAFAAGLITGLLRGEDLGRCLRRGHLGAAAVLTVPGDTAPPLDPALLDLDDAAWAAVRVRADSQVLT
ncbi:sugar kinase [Pseudonocardia sp. CA-107938]|uniref:sugar kinase n=1 Tax=Pseudonocardia sp. CA-107938 TaxID=3240021 RepID=UPI003D8A7870